MQKTITTDQATDWPNVETDMNAWREWAKAENEETVPVMRRRNLIRYSVREYPL